MIRTAFPLTSTTVLIFSRLIIQRIEQKIKQIIKTFVNKQLIISIKSKINHVIIPKTELSMIIVFWLSCQAIFNISINITNICSKYLLIKLKKFDLA